MNDYFLDTCIFMYAAGKEHRYKRPCVDILKMAREGLSTFHIDTELIQEILYRYYHLGMIDSALELSWSVLDLLPEVLSVSLADVKLALFYNKKYQKLGIPPRDFIHLAVMLNNGIDKIVTADQHFNKFEEVQRIDPVDFII